MNRKTQKNYFCHEHMTCYRQCVYLNNMKIYSRLFQNLRRMIHQKVFESYQTYLWQSSILNLMEMCHLSPLTSYLYPPCRKCSFCFFHVIKNRKLIADKFVILIHIFEILWCTHLHERRNLMDISIPNVRFFL